MTSKMKITQKMFPSPPPLKRTRPEFCLNDLSAGNGIQHDEYNKSGITHVHVCKDDYAKLYIYTLWELGQGIKSPEFCANDASI